MDEARRLKRHAELFEAGETSVRRIGIGGAIFALVVLLTVIEPFHIESSRAQSEIEVRQGEVRVLAGDIERIESLRQELEGMSERIANQPWTDEIETLKDDFREGRVTEPRAHSNEVLSDIAAELRAGIVEPLRPSIVPLGEGHELSSVPEDIDGAIRNWHEEYRKSDWWITTDRKDDAGRAIGNELDVLLSRATKDAAKIGDELAAASGVLAGEIRQAERRIDALVADLQGVMDDALPGWARGFLDVRQLLVIYPWLLAGIAVFLTATALRTTYHFHAMAEGEGWSADERRDPLLSTAWTVTPRGPAGSLATVATYGAVFAVLGLCIYRSQHPPETEAQAGVQASVDAIASTAGWSALFAYAVFAAAVAVVAANVFRKQPG